MSDKFRRGNAMDKLIKNSGFEKMISDIEALVNASKNELATSINKVMTVTYWSIGKYIVEFEQDGNAKAEYGKNLLSRISKELTLRLGKG